MFNSPFSMIVAIVFIVMAAKVIMSWNRNRAGVDDDGRAVLPEGFTTTQRHMSEEVKRLSERVAVLERILTDERKSRDLDREIEKLRD
jgi:hypothetical protein